MNDIINIFSKLLTYTWFRIALVFIAPITVIIICYAIDCIFTTKELERQRKIDLGLTWKE